jgi:hypothetical protein
VYGRPNQLYEIGEDGYGDDVYEVGVFVEIGRIEASNAPFG